MNEEPLFVSSFTSAYSSRRPGGVKHSLGLIEVLTEKLGIEDHAII